MFAKERPLPRALNIVRPPSLFNGQDSIASSPSEISTISNFSTYSASRPQPTIFNPASFFQNNLNTFKSPVGVNPHRFLSRPRSSSTVSTLFSAFSDYSNQNADDEEDDLDSIDGMTDDEEDIKVVARVRHGTIMNGKGEFVNKGSKNEHWLDEARANRKIADLEIENQTLLSLNATLEAKSKQQRVQISELEKRLQFELPLTPISDCDESLYSFCSLEEEESDKIFLRVKSTLENLIEQAEVALIEKSKHSEKRVVQRTRDHEDALRKLTMRSPSPTELKKNTKRVSETRPASVKMSRNLSRQSSPPVMQPSLQRSASPSLQPSLRRSASSLDRAVSPSLHRPSSPSLRRSPSSQPSAQSRPSSRLSHKGSDKPKWH